MRLFVLRVGTRPVFVFNAEAHSKAVHFARSNHVRGHLRRYGANPRKALPTVAPVSFDQAQRWYSSHERAVQREEFEGGWNPLTMIWTAPVRA